MIVLDTNVISELWKAAPEPNVLAWIDAQSVETLYLSAVTVAELRFGLAAMPAGKRRSIYQERLEREVLTAFTGRVLRSRVVFPAPRATPALSRPPG
jgi:predicted nucleic acid-binding protein